MMSIACGRSSRLFKAGILPAFFIFAVANCASYMPINQPSGSLLNFNIPNTEFRSLGVAEGRGCESAIFGFIFLTNDFAYQAAVDSAVSSLGGDVFIQTSTDAHIYGIPPIYHRRCVIVKGIVLKIASRMKETPVAPERSAVSKGPSTPEKPTSAASKVPFFDIARKGAKVKSLGSKTVRSSFRIAREANFPPELAHLQKGGASLFVVHPTDSKADVLLHAGAAKRGSVEERLSSEVSIAYRYLADFSDDGRYVPVIEFVAFEDQAE